MKYQTPLIGIMSVAMLFTGCSKHSAGAVASHPKVQNLGVVEVSDGIQSQHGLGGGRICIVTPTMLKDGNVLLDLRIEEAGNLLSAPRIITKPDQAVEISVGDIGVGFTPHIK
jgi:hypothetical protein